MNTDFVTMAGNLDQDNVSSLENLTNILDTNYLDDYDLLIKRVDNGMSIAVPIVFSVIFLVGIVGNGLLVFIVIRIKSMRTKPNVFIVSLAVGDFLLVLVSVPLSSTYYTVHAWIFGIGMCKITEFMSTLSLGVSVFTLTALSGDRFVAIVYPMTIYRSSSLRRTLYIAASIWILAIILALPDLVAGHVKFESMMLCDLYPESWGSWYKKFRVICRFLIFFLLPIAIITVFYTIIAVVLLRKSSLNNQRDSAMRKQAESRKKVAKVVLSFIIIFIICWLPRHIFIIGFRFDLIEYNMFWHFFKMFAFCLIFIYSSVNPFALYFLNEEFRKYFDHYLFGCCCRSRRFRSVRLERTMTCQPTSIQNISMEDLVDNNCL